MGYFDGLVNVLFKKTKEGKTIFYPYGKKSGCIVSEETEKDLKSFLKKFYIIFLTSIVLSIVFFKESGLMIILAIFILAIPIYFIKIKKSIVNAELTSTKNTHKDRVRNMAKAFGPVISIIMLTISLIMVVASIVCIFVPEARVMGIIGTLFFGLGLIQAVFLVKYALGEKKEKVF